MITGRETFVIDLNGRIVFAFDAFTKGAPILKELWNLSGE